MKNTTKQHHSDRFIPFRSHSEPKNSLINPILHNQSHTKDLSSVHFHTAKQRKQLTFCRSLSTREQSVFEFMNSLQNSEKTASRQYQPININCYKIIDIPGVVDNFYYNTLDISRNDFVGIGLGSDLHMFREKDNSTISFDEKRNYSLITCVKFTLFDELLISANEDGLIQIHDSNKVKSIRTYKKHSLRIGRVETDDFNPCLFYSGSKDYNININDFREKKAVISTLKSHKTQICGLSLKGNYLASGGNDGSVKIWDIRAQKLLETFNHHKGAVKALSWCPWRTNILASGGGRKDQQILIYDFNENKIEKTICVNNQITDFCWRASTQQLIYSYGRQNRGCIKTSNYFCKKRQNKKLIGHTGRIIGLRTNKNKDNIVCSVSGDESLRFWDMDSFCRRIKAEEVINCGFTFQ